VSSTLVSSTTTAEIFLLVWDLVNNLLISIQAISLVSIVILEIAPVELSITHWLYLILLTFAVIDWVP
jgi:hypothetical protein